MPRDRLLFKFTGDGSEFHPGIPQRDLRESDKAWLTDADLVVLAASPIYTARNDAEDEAIEAAERIQDADVPPPGAPPAPTVAEVAALVDEEPAKARSKK
jgi:hypothetical protein